MNIHDIAKKFDGKVKKQKAGVGRKTFDTVWANVRPTEILDRVEQLIDVGFPHLATISGTDLGDKIRLTYHFTHGQATGEEFIVNFVTTVPKTKPVIHSICALVPGALVAEREKIEFLGVKFEGIPDARKLFLPDDWKGAYPWRKDGKIEKRLERIDKRRPKK